MNKELNLEEIQFIGRKDSNWKDNIVRILITEEHGNLFVGKDIAEILEFHNDRRNPNVAQMTRFMKTNEYLKIEKNEGAFTASSYLSDLFISKSNKITLITEKALNKAIMRSDREAAKDFQDFIAEMLIKIRKEYNLDSTFDLMNNDSKQEQVLKDISFISKDAKARQYTIHKNMLKNLLNPKRIIFIESNIEANIKIMELFDNPIYKKKSEMDENELAARERLMPLISEQKILIENLKIFNDKYLIESIKLKSIEPLMKKRESITVDEEIHKTADFMKHLSLEINKIQKNLSYYQSRLIQAIKDISIEIEEKQLKKLIKQADKNIMDIDFYKKEKITFGFKINKNTIKLDGILKHLAL